MYIKNVIFLEKLVYKDVLHTYYTAYVESGFKEPHILQAINFELQRLSTHPVILPRTRLLLQDMFLHLSEPELLGKILDILLFQEKVETVRDIVQLLADRTCSAVAYEILMSRLPQASERLRALLGAECYAQIWCNTEEAVGADIEQRFLQILTVCRHTASVTELEDKYLLASTVTEQQFVLRIFAAVGGPAPARVMLKLARQGYLPIALDREVIVTLGLLRQSSAVPLLQDFQQKYQGHREIMYLVRAALRAIHSS